MGAALKFQYDETIAEIDIRDAETYSGSRHYPVPGEAGEA